MAFGRAAVSRLMQRPDCGDRAAWLGVVVERFADGDAGAEEDRAGGEADGPASRKRAAATAAAGALRVRSGHGS
jgi:hypothetical protein